MLKVLVPAVAVASFAASGAFALSPDLILGKWRGTGDPKDCPLTELSFTRDTYAFVSNGAGYKAHVLGYALQAGNRNEISVTTGHIDTYKMIGSNDMQLETAYGPCAYTREH
jgi:hypothetical protein